MKEQIILIAAVQVNVERHGSQCPQENIFVRKECEQGTADTEPGGPIGEYRKPADIGPDIVRMSILEQADCPPVCAQHADCQEKAIYDKDCGKYSCSPDPHIFRQEHLGCRQCRIDQPQSQMDHRPPPGDKIVNEECHQCRTEEPVAHEVYRHIGQYGDIQCLKPYVKKEVHSIAGSKNEQSRSHHLSRLDETRINHFLGNTREQHVQPEKQKQRQGNAKGIVI